MKNPISTLKILWMAFVGNLPLMAAVPFFAIQSEPTPIPSEYLAIFYFLGILEIVLGYVLPSFLLKGKDLSNPRILLAPFVIRWACFEVCSIVGIVLAITQQSTSAHFPFIGMSAVAFALNFPTEDKLKNFGAR